MLTLISESLLVRNCQREIADNAFSSWNMSNSTYANNAVLSTLYSINACNAGNNFFNLYTLKEINGYLLVVTSTPFLLCCFLITFFKKLNKHYFVEYL